MKRKALKIAALWLALIALAVVDTDREQDTWLYDTSYMSWILESEADAQAAQREADEALAQERADAYARRDSGLWGKKAELEDTLKCAFDGTPGLNLMWGEYEAVVRYVSGEPMTMRVVSAGRQAFIEGGEAVLHAAPQGAEETLRFTLTDSTERLMLACDVPENATVLLVTVRRVGQRVCSPDLLMFAVLAGGVLTWLAVLY